MISPGANRNGAVQGMASRDQLREARRLYRRALRGRAPDASTPDGVITGCWSASPDLPVTDLARAIQDAEQTPATTLIKDDHRVRVARARLLGCDALIKRYEMGSPCEQAKYLFRASRARRYWAAASALQAMHVPTPDALGFLEIRRRGMPVRSYVVTTFISRAVSSRIWIEPEFHSQPDAIRMAVLSGLRDALLALYRRGVYHRDTKTSNLLLKLPVDLNAPVFMWIDLECVQFGRHPTRHDIIRNLVQLNGSFGTHMSDDDRLAFFRSFADVFPWVMDGQILDKIRRWTDRRLNREQTLPCGP